jgi:hypothetical protein
MIIITLPFVLVGLIWAFCIGLYVPAVLFILLAVLPISNLIILIPELINTHIIGQRAPSLQVFITSASLIIYVCSFYVTAIYFYSGLDLIPVMLLIMSYALSISTGIYQAIRKIYGCHDTLLAIELYGSFSHRALFLSSGTLFFFAPIITLIGCIYALL